MVHLIHQTAADTAISRW